MPPFLAREISNSGSVKTLFPSGRQISTILDTLCLASGVKEAVVNSVRATVCSEMSISSLWPTLLIRSRSLSKARRSILMISGLGAISLLRISPITFSILWARFLMLLRPKKPAPPLMEWAARKALLTRSSSMSAPAFSMANRSFSILARCSSDSSTYECNISSSSMLIVLLLSK